MYLAADGRWRASYRAPGESRPRTVSAATREKTVAKRAAPKTVGHHRQTLAQVMDQAVELNLIAANPVRRVHAPCVRRTTARSLSVDEARALVAAANSDPYGAVVALVFSEGWHVSKLLNAAAITSASIYGLLIDRAAAQRSS